MKEVYYKLFLPIFFVFIIYLPINSNICRAIAKKFENNKILIVGGAVTFVSFVALICFINSKKLRRSEKLHAIIANESVKKVDQIDNVGPTNIVEITEEDINIRRAKYEEILRGQYKQCVNNLRFIFTNDNEWENFLIEFDKCREKTRFLLSTQPEQVKKEIQGDEAKRIDYWLNLAGIDPRTVSYRYLDGDEPEYENTNAYVFYDRESTKQCFFYVNSRFRTQDQTIVHEIGHLLEGHIIESPLVTDIIFEKNNWKEYLDSNEYILFRTHLETIADRAFSIKNRDAAMVRFHYLVREMINSNNGALNKLHYLKHFKMRIPVFQEFVHHVDLLKIIYKLSIGDALHTAEIEDFSVHSDNCSSNNCYVSNLLSNAYNEADDSDWEIKRIQNSDINDLNS